MNTRRRTPLLAIACCCLALLMILAACKDDNACLKALQERDKRIKQMQLVIIDLNNQLKNLRSVLQMKQKEVGVFKDAPVTSSDAYQKCRLRADRLQVRLDMVEKERTEYKLRYEALKKNCGQ